MCAPFHSVFERWKSPKSSEKTFCEDQYMWPHRPIWADLDGHLLLPEWLPLVLVSDLVICKSWVGCNSVLWCFYCLQSESLEKVYGIFTSDKVEHTVRKSAADQIVLILQGNVTTVDWIALIWQGNVTTADQIAILQDNVTTVDWIALIRQGNVSLYWLHGKLEGAM